MIMQAGQADPGTVEVPTLHHADENFSDCLEKKNEVYPQVIVTLLVNI